MKLAFNQARRILGNTGDNPAVGCLIVKKNVVISLSHTHQYGRPHAEKIALLSKKNNFKGSTMYSTLEPCSHYAKTPPCTNIIKKKNIKYVVYSKLDPDKRSFNKTKKILSYYKIRTLINVCKANGNVFYKDYSIKKKTKKVFITSKLATSRDLFISHKYHKLITNNYSRSRVHLLRANHDAILTTLKTILDDNPYLNCRIRGLEKYSPIRIILDKNLKIPLSSKIIKTSTKNKTFIFYNNSNRLKLKKIKKLKVIAVKIKLKNNHLDFDKIVFYIRKKGICRIFVEAGIKFNEYLLKNNYINEFYHFYSNNFFGKNGNYNAGFFFNRMSKSMRSKKKIKVNLYQNMLIKYLIK